MRILKTGDPCPICGKPILTDDPNTLRLLAAIADIVGIPEPEDHGTKHTPAEDEPPSWAEHFARRFDRAE